MFKQPPDNYVQPSGIINFFYHSGCTLLSLYQRFMLRLITGAFDRLPS